MAEYIDREEYCEKHCRCSNEYCDKESCPIWKAPAADVAPVVHGRKIENGNVGCFGLCSHRVCSLSSKSALRCITGEKSQYTKFHEKESCKS